MGVVILVVAGVQMERCRTFGNTESFVELLVTRRAVAPQHDELLLGVFFAANLNREDAC